MKQLFLMLSIAAVLFPVSDSFAQTKYSAHISLPDPLQTPSICMVMIDPDTEKNMIIWEKEPNPLIYQYHVYKISGTGNLLVSSSLESDTSTIIDSGSKPDTKTDAYCLVAIDTCGNASQNSSWHKPFLLQSNLGTNGVINLSWQPYLVNNQEYIFKSIVIYRGTDSTKLVGIDTISAGIGSTSYTDLDPPLNVNVYYRIGGEKESPCDPNNISGKKASKGPYVHSLSNLEDNRLQSTGITGYRALREMKIYPNPLVTESRISWINPDGNLYDLFIFDLKGTLVRKIPQLNTQEYHLSRENLESGCYIIELRGNKTFHGRLLVN